MKTIAKPLKPKFQNRSGAAALAVKVVYSFGAEKKDTRFVIFPVSEIKHCASGNTEDDKMTYLKSGLDFYVQVRLPLDEFWKKMAHPDQDGLVDLTAFTGPEDFLATYYKTAVADVAVQEGDAQAASQQIATAAKLLVK